MKTTYQLLALQLNPSRRDGQEMEDAQMGKKGKSEETTQGGGSEVGK